jgi:hypothetical protein
MERRIFPLRIKINRRWIDTVVIDPHYEEKHSSSISDEIILELVMKLDGGVFEAGAIGKNGHEYYTTEPLYYLSKPYRLVWLLPPEGSYLGIINCFRRSYGKRKN